MFGLTSWKLFHSAGQALTRKGGLIESVPILADAMDRLRHRLLNPVVTRIIRDPKDPDFVQKNFNKCIDLALVS